MADANETSRETGRKRGEMKVSKYVVQCEIHGTEKFKDGPKEVFVQPPKTRKQRVSGCPMCAKKRVKKV